MNSTLCLLLVDDDEIDVFAVQRTIRKQQITNPLYIAQDGQRALEMLRGTGGQPPLPHPLLILLDLNMPRMGGIEFLEQLRADPVHQHHQVLVITTSSDTRDREAADRLGVIGYLLKENLAEHLGHLLQGRPIPVDEPDVVNFVGEGEISLPPEAFSLIPGIDPHDVPEPMEVAEDLLTEDDPALQPLPGVVDVEPELLESDEPVEPVDILLIDDDEIDARAVARALSTYNLPHRLHWEIDGVTALKRLRGVRGTDPLPRPLVILLDLGLPRMHGIDVLKELRRDPTLRHHVVFVMSTSEAPRDLADAYAAGQVAGYLPKSRLGDDWGGLALMLDAYLRVVELPKD